MSFWALSGLFLFKTQRSGDWILSELTNRMSYQRHVGGFIVCPAGDVRCNRQDLRFIPYRLTFRNIGQDQAQHRKHKKLKFTSGQACDRYTV
jgi:hypothetical protein